MSKFSIAPDNLKAPIKTFGDASGKLRDYSREMDDISNNLDSSFSEVVPVLQVLSKRTNDHSVDVQTLGLCLGAAAAEYEKHDRLVQTKVKSTNSNPVVPTAFKNSNAGQNGTRGANNQNNQNTIPKSPGINHDKVEEYAKQWDIKPGSTTWTTADILYWKTFGGDDYLFQEKANFVKNYSAVIKDAAAKYGIPEYLLAGVAFSEYGGDPLWIDDVAYDVRAFDWCGPDFTDQFTITKKPELTSFGNLSMQVRRAAEMYGYDPNNLTSEQSRTIINDLKDPVKSIYITAAHLRDLKDIDYADIPSDAMTNDMIRDVATRYNRGPDISLDEVHNNTSYGDSILRHEEEIKNAMGG